MYARSVPFCAGILSIGIGTSGKRIGIGSGMIPNGAYFAHSSATRASIGIAGNGRPLKSCMSITFGQVLAGDGDACRASPWLPACTSTFVITPSNSGCGVPFKRDDQQHAQRRRRQRRAVAGGDQEDRVELATCC